MRKIVACIYFPVLISTTFLFSCASAVDSVQKAASSKLHDMVASQFSRGLLKGIDTAITQLSAKGGFINNPLVHVLLPPPLGLALGVAAELKSNPKAALLDVLINQAAENTVPIAGPILKDIVQNMATPTLESVVSGGSTAATDYLKANAGDAVKKALLPAITEQLQISGAVELYGELAKHEAELQAASDVAQAASGTAPTAAKTAQPMTPEQLSEYVAEQTAGGLFRKVAEAELSVRESIVLPH